MFLILAAMCSSVPMKGVKSGYRKQLVVSAALGNSCSLKQVVRFNYSFPAFKGNVGKIKLHQSIKIRM